jgi:hypothetical protein
MSKAIHYTVTEEQHMNIKLSWATWGEMASYFYTN